MNVEGAELEVLKGATNVLSKSKDISLLIEIHTLGNEKTPYQPIKDLLNNYNFKKILRYYMKMEKNISLSADGNYNLRYIR